VVFPSLENNSRLISDTTAEKEIREQTGETPMFTAAENAVARLFTLVTFALSSRMIC
jgi:hypothetical protein